MFARPSRRVFVCLRCRSRLAEQAQGAPWLSQSDRKPLQPQRRWQSAAVAVAAEDVQDQGDDQGYPRPRTRSENKFKGEKVWKPNETAKLGVSSLGKPAEVLLLKERDRPIPEAPADAEEGREGDVLTAAWSTDNQSLSAEQLIKNIEHIRDQAKQDPDRDIEVHRGRLRKRLQEGFSAKQLRNYIEQKQGVATKLWARNRQSKNFRFSVKLQMARYIFKHIWGIHGSDTAETTDVVEAEKSREVVMSSNALELLLLADNSSLRQISMDHKVQIDFFRQPAKILVSGPSSSVDAARRSLLQLQKKVKKQNISLGNHMTVGDEANDSTLLADIRQLYNVHLIGRKKALRVYYHEDTLPDLAGIRRHVLLAHRQGLQSSCCTIWPKVSPETSQQVLLGHPGRGSIGARGSGKRLIASSEQTAVPSMPQMSEEQKSSFSVVYKATREALTFPPMQLRKISTQPGMRIENKASFGQALVNDDKSGLKLDPTAITQATPSFTSQIPLLSRFLAQRKPWKDDVQQTSPFKRSSELAPDDAVGEGLPRSQSTQFTYELTLGSAPQTASFPRLKIQLVGADVSLGLKQPLQIQAISAVLGEKTAYLLLPSQAVDVKFESQILRDIYREGHPSDTGHAKLLSQLAEYFNQVGSLPDPTFAPFTKLSIPTEIRARVPNALRKKDHDPDDGHEYILESATALDVASYRPPFLSKLCLEHVVFLGDNRGDGREILQLAEQPRFSAPVKHKTSFKFASFFNSAYEIALSLGDPALLSARKS